MLFHKREPFINHLEFAHRTTLAEGGKCLLCFDTLGDDRGLFALHLLQHLEETALAALPRACGIEFTLEASDTDSMPSLPGDNSIYNAVAIGGSIHSAPETEKQYQHLPQNAQPEVHVESLKHDQIPAISSETGAKDTVFEDEFSKSEQRNPGPLSTSLSVRQDTIIPTLEGFESHVRQLNARIQPFLIHRIGSEQLRRYNRLVDLKLKHDYTTATGICLSGKHCSALGGKATILAPRISHIGPGTTYVGSEPSKCDSDTKEAIAEATVSVELFPPGIPLPPVKRLPAEFECSLCFKVQKVHKPSDWVKHFYEDIQAFTCTFPDCTDTRSFKRRADWVRHENERHRHLEWWQCNMPDCSHICYRRDNFVQHLVREHRLAEPKTRVHGSGIAKADDWAASDEHVWKLVDSCHVENSREPKDERCRFCGNICSSWKKLALHLGKHLEQIALPIVEIVSKKAPDGT